MPEEMQLLGDSLESPLSLLDEPARQALTESVVGDYRRWKQARSRLESKWRECWEAYLCDVKSMYTQPEADQSDRSRVARPVLYEAVETIHSHLLNSLFPANERFFTISGKTEADHRHASLIEEFLRNKLEGAGFLEKYSLFLKQAIITGNTVAAVPWVVRREIRRVEKPVQLFGVTVGYEKTLRNELVYNGPDFEVLDIFDFLIDPDATDISKAKVIRKLERTMRELEEANVYSNLEHVQASVLLEMDDANKLSKRRAFGLEQTQPKDLDPENGKIKLLEVWGDFVVNGQVYSNYVCVVANGKTVIRFEPNPYDCGLKPFVFTSFISVPNEVYGIGAIEKSLGLQHAINTLTNQKLDVINLSINAPFTYLINDDIFDPETMVTRPGALIPVKSHDTLRPIQYLSNYTVAFEEIADLKSEVQEATGALKFFTGGESNTPRTATEVAALVSGGRQKFSSFLAHLEHTSLAPFLKRVLEYARQFVTQSELLRLQGADEHGPRYQKLLPDILKTAQCCFRIDGSSGQIFKEQELKSLTAFLQLAESSPALQGQVDLPTLYKKIYRRLGFADEADIFKPMAKTEEQG